MDGDWRDRVQAGDEVTVDWGDGDVPGRVEWPTADGVHLRITDPGADRDGRRYLILWPQVTSHNGTPVTDEMRQAAAALEAHYERHV